MYWFLLGLLICLVVDHILRYCELCLLIDSDKGFTIAHFVFHIISSPWLTLVKLLAVRRQSILFANLSVKVYANMVIVALAFAL
jgi:hypothetical protein